MNELKRNILYNILMSENVDDELRDNIDFLISIIPEIKDTIGFNQLHPHHHLDVWEHTLDALSRSKMIFEIRLALLLHDIGKPHCYQFDGEVNHYRDHNRVSHTIAKNSLENLGYDGDTINTVCEIILRHDTPIHQGDIDADLKLSQMVFEVQCCDIYAHNPEYNKKRLEYIDRIAKMLN